MKLTFLLMLIGCMQLSARSSGQLVTLHVKDMPLKTLLRDVQRQTGLNILMDASLLEHAPRVSLRVRQMPVEGVLELCLKNTPLGFSIESGAIIIDKKPDAVQPAREAPRQDKPVTGTIRNAKGEPVPGAAIQVKGTSRGVLSDATGRFTIEAADNAVLVVSMMGHVSVEIRATSGTVLNIVLQEAVTALNDVVVIGYGAQKKSDLTGAIAQVKTAELTEFPTTNVMQALSGRAAGIQVTQNSGAPGSPVSLRIRGTNSIQGSNEPLYVVDGFPITGNPTMLNNADIESMDVLKDASATAIYGSRGANGVVLITTRKGKSGRTRVDYEGSFGVQQIRKKLALMSPIQYGEFYNLQAKNDGVPAYFSDQQLAAFRASGKGTDWQDLMTRKAPMHQHTLTISGGAEKTQFSLSGSMLKQDGIVINSNHKRYVFRGNMQHNLHDKFSIQYSLNLSRTETNDKNGGDGGRGNSLFSGMISVPSSLRPYDDRQVLTVPILAYPFISNAMINPLNYLYEQDNRGRENRVLGNAAIIYKPFPSITVRISGGIENTDIRTDAYTTSAFVNSDGAAAVNNASFTSLLNENTISYDLSANAHRFTALAGFTYQHLISTSTGTSGSGFVSDVPGTHDLGAAAIINPATSAYSQAVLISYLSRVNYAYNDKYLLTASIRADGSSRYGAGNKWGYFPSAALAWRVSRENFMKNISLISDLKVRASVGATGSQAIAPYATLNQLVSGKTVFDDAMFTTYSPGTRRPNNLKWETTYQTDLGLDVALAGNRLYLTADYYIKNTRNLLNNVQLPVSMGYTYTIQNVGVMQNKGFEMTLNGSPLKASSPLQWTLGGNISVNRNKIVTLYGGQDIYGTSYYTGLVSDFVNLLREGQPMGVFYGYQENGYDKDGKIVYKDITGDGAVTVADKTIIGNPHPDFIYGFNTSFAWRGLELSAFFQGSHGNDIFNFSATQSVDLGQGLNLLEEQFHQHWTPTRTNTKYPAVTRSQNVAVSDRFVEDGSYLRLKNIRLAYNVPVKYKAASWMKSGQIWISGQNLLTRTNYSWYDPEVSAHMADNSVNLGIDQFGYPTAKSVTVGLRIGL